MAKVQLQTLIDDFKSALGYPYVSPGHTSMSSIKNGVDCSGLFVAAFKHQGCSIYHGSNTIWRQYLTQKGPLKSTSQLFPGCAVFKWSASGQPSKYVSDGQGNFQHIGLCISVNPLKIIHASTDGMVVKTDTSIGKWKYWGRLKDVNYGNEIVEDIIDEVKPEQEATSMGVVGGTLQIRVDKLNIRQAMSTQSKRLGSVPRGTKLEYEGSIGNGWVKICYKKIQGYICCDSKYVNVLSVNEDQIDDEYKPEDVICDIAYLEYGADQEDVIDVLNSLLVRVAALQEK